MPVALPEKEIGGSHYTKNRLDLEPSGFLPTCSACPLFPHAESHYDASIGGARGTMADLEVSQQEKQHPLRKSHITLRAKPTKLVSPSLFADGSTNVHQKVIDRRILMDEAECAFTSAFGQNLWLGGDASDNYDSGIGALLF